MQITIKIGACYDSSEKHTLVINGKARRYIHSLSECPEDAIVGRDLVDAFDIVGFMREAWEAGKAGEALEVGEEKVSGDDD